MNILNKKFLLVPVIGLGIIILGSLGFWNLKSDVNDLKIMIAGNNDGPIGGITRTVIGAQTRWLTDLIPSASYTVDLGSLTLPVNNIFAVGASYSGNVNFLGELKPDGALCSNNQILKKTGTNDWDCAADATGTVASNSLDFDEFVNSMTLDANVTIASTSNNYTWDFLDTQVSFPGGRILTNGNVGIGTTGPGNKLSVAFDNPGIPALGVNGGQLGLFNGGSQYGLIAGVVGTGNSYLQVQRIDATATAYDLLLQPNDGNVGIGTTGPDGMLHIKSASPKKSLILQSTAGAQGDIAGMWFKTTADTTADAYAKGAIIFEDNGLTAARGDLHFALDNAADVGNAGVADAVMTLKSSGNVGIGNTGPTTKLDVIGNASVSLNFEVGKIIGNSASHSFGGTIEGITDNTLSFGTTAKKIKQIIVNTIRAIVKLVLPTITTLTETGEFGYHSASKSLDWYDGTNQQVIRANGICKTFVVDSPTAANPGKVGPVMFNDPFTLTSVQAVASGSNAAGWNLRYGAPGSITTSVFTLPKSASTSSYPTYTSFANSTLGNNNALEVIISSRSATLQSFSVTACGRYNH